MNRTGATASVANRLALERVWESCSPSSAVSCLRSIAAMRSPGTGKIISSILIVGSNFFEKHVTILVAWQRWLIAPVLKTGGVQNPRPFESGRYRQFWLIGECCFVALVSKTSLAKNQRPLNSDMSRQFDR